ncbi:beta-phosphoglucomutase [Hymenobacter sp. DG25B]|uniref:beta-phosphoglucomutase n=1 Tax=Hymenobacter sp. DG25B TaxID=1385664 RepID=UPI000540E0F8|nr:beta-phosphoglucomutase [Hymenobacter sp. DG25B]AIZ62676.1 beta-phosphoglucomutase [Hymenobacter sp. DG25B]
MATIKACLFDLDGVIVDTAKFHYQAWKSLADGLNIDFTEHHNERLKGVSRMRSLEIILEIGGVTMPEDEQVALATRKNEVYLEDVHRMTEADLLPGVRRFLEECRAAGLKTALGSASKNARLILERVQLLPLFDAIIDGTDVANAKPDPEVFLKGAEALGVAPEECVVFEDAVAGLEAARNGGMHCIGVGDATILSEADFVIPGFEEMTVARLQELKS